MKYFFIIFGIIFTQNLTAQKTLFSDIRIKSDYYTGFLLPEYEFVNYFAIDNIKAFDIEIVKDFKGQKLWEQVYNYPSIGISFYHGTLGNNLVFGNVTALYPSISIPLFEKKKFLISSETGIGIAYASEIFNLENNYRNIAVASHFNIWFREALNLSYQINEKFSVSTGTAFGHFSNANLREPNLGLNFWTFYAGADALISRKTEKITKQIPEFIKKNEFALIIAAGGKHTRRFAERSYFAGSFSGEYRRILGFKGGLGTGLDIFYDASIPDEMKRAGKTNIKQIYKLKTGIHLSQELRVGKLSLIIQEGFYIGFKDYLNNRLMYNRGIVRYRISDRLFLNMAMKTNLWILDVMELGLGYNIGKL